MTGSYCDAHALPNQDVRKSQLRSTLRSSSFSSQPKQQPARTHAPVPAGLRAPRAPTQSRNSGLPPPHLANNEQGLQQPSNNSPAHSFVAAGNLADYCWVTIPPSRGIVAVQSEPLPGTHGSTDGAVLRRTPSLGATRPPTRPSSQCVQLGVGAATGGGRLRHLVTSGGLSSANNSHSLSCEPPPPPPPACSPSPSSCSLPSGMTLNNYFWLAAGPRASTAASSITQDQGMACSLPGPSKAPANRPMSRPGSQLQQYNPWEQPSRRTLAGNGPMQQGRLSNAGGSRASSRNGHAVGAQSHAGQSWGAGRGASHTQHTIPPPPPARHPDVSGHTYAQVAGSLPRKLAPLNSISSKPSRTSLTSLAEDLDEGDPPPFKMPGPGRPLSRCLSAASSMDLPPSRQPHGHVNLVATQER